MTAKQILENICRDNTHLLDEPEIKEIEKVMQELIEGTPSQEQFNHIQDLRTYLCGGNQDRTIDCLHYLGDDAQAWWVDRQLVLKQLSEMKKALNNESENAFLNFLYLNHRSVLGCIYNIDSLKK